MEVLGYALAAHTNKDIFISLLKVYGNNEEVAKQNIFNDDCPSLSFNKHLTSSHSGQVLCMVQGTPEQMGCNCFSPGVQYLRQ